MSDPVPIEPNLIDEIPLQENCLELRSMAAIMSRMPELAERVDAFVSEHIGVLRESRAFFALPRIDVEVRAIRVSHKYI